jgi:hypothetical protein
MVGCNLNWAASMVATAADTVNSVPQLWTILLLQEYGVTGLSMT